MQEASSTAPTSSGSQWRGIMAAGGQNASLSEGRHVVSHLHPQSPLFQAETKPGCPTGLNILIYSLPATQQRDSVADEALGVGSYY